MGKYSLEGIYSLQIKVEKGIRVLNEANEVE